MVPTGRDKTMAYYIIDTSKMPGYMHDAARPYLLIERYHSTYKDSGRLRTRSINRYGTRSAARRYVNRNGFVMGDDVKA